MNRLTLRLVLLLVVALGLAGCFVRGQENPLPRRTPAPDRPTSVPPDPATTAALQVYFPRLFEDGTLGLRAVPRTVSTEGGVTARLVEAMLAGPSGDERAESLYPALDRRTRLLDVTVVGDLAAIEFDQELRRVIGMPFSELVYWAIVYTATEATPVARVTLIQSGEPLVSFGAPTVSITPGASRTQAPAWVRPR